MHQLKDDRPIFHQITEYIQNQVVDGYLKEGDKIPSTNELASFYQINPATALKGINQLVDKQVIYKKRGIGMFVQEGAKSILINERREQFADQFIRPMVKEAERIGFSKQDLHSILEEEKG
ncbi:GntR family transcriptional regulator [Halobacillus amylolyticus]|uniref:GntR family transcriptional regulator n=1 Tax=Halobacillus amylolyticus TaxID=2932259 RepID=A0ABY4HAX4_9BACI|nr:GntR family transcriptional regulator [Halobacillus amylolyticus]UOR11849.1 GntR family transcriptional regulator [Halobacillus amylolyticus]